MVVDLQLNHQHSYCAKGTVFLKATEFKKYSLKLCKLLQVHPVLIEVTGVATCLSQGASDFGVEISGVERTARRHGEVASYLPWNLKKSILNPYQY